MQAEFVPSRPTAPVQEAQPAYTKPLYTRDAIAIGMSIGMKLKGASILEAFAWGIGVRVVLNAIDWPKNCVVAPVGGVDARELFSMAADLTNRRR